MIYFVINNNIGLHIQEKMLKNDYVKNIKIS